MSDASPVPCPRLIKIRVDRHEFVWLVVCGVWQIEGTPRRPPFWGWQLTCVYRRQ